MCLRWLDGMKISFSCFGGAIGDPFDCSLLIYSDGVGHWGIKLLYDEV